MKDRGRSPPTPAAIKEKRLSAKLTQVEAATLVHAWERRWRDWESGHNGMSLATWELFVIKADQIIEDRR